MRSAATGRGGGPRRLDRQNAHSATLAADFARFGVKLWVAVGGVDPSVAARRRRLGQLNLWRNAIAHLDFRQVATSPLTRGTRADLATVRTWRSALDRLAGRIERAMVRRLTATLGTAPLVEIRERELPS